jgi:hypothetical protein
MTCSRVAAFISALIFGATPAICIEFAEVSREGRPHLRVVTGSATYFYDIAGGGFSSLLDNQGCDWIQFHAEPLDQFPASAAAGYRGLPNLLFGKQNPDAGAGHPGFNQCSSQHVGAHAIRTETKSGLWAWTWSFTHTNAVLRIEKADPNHAFWFLYEGPIAGSFSPSTKYWGTNLGGPRFDTPDLRSQLFGSWRWAYFGDINVNQLLFVAQVKPDDLPDTMWYLGNTDAGLEAPDGMVVFGFGRGPGAKPRFTAAGHIFVIGFIGRNVSTPADHERTAAIIESHIAQHASN